MANTPISGPGTTPGTAVVDASIFPMGGSGKPTTTAAIFKTYIGVPLVLGTALQGLRVNAGATTLEYYTATANPMTTLGDLIIGGTVTSGVAAPTRLAIGTANQLLHGGASAPSYSAVVEADLGLTDITTANSSTSKHGFLLKLNNTATSYMDGTGAWSTPTGTGWALTGTSTFSGAVTIVGTATNILKFNFDLSTTPTNGAGHWLYNNTTASAGVALVSPSTVWEVNAWKTTATAASQSMKFMVDVLAVESTTTPGATWRIRQSINAGAYADVFTATPNPPSFAATGAYFVLMGGQDSRLAFNSVTTHYINSNTTLNKFTMRAQTGYMTFNMGGTDYMSIWDGSAGGVKIGDVSIGTTSDVARLGIVQAALTTTHNPVTKFTPGTHTGMNTATVYPHYIWEGSTITIASGTVAVQPFAWMKASTYAGTSGTATATIAATLQVDPPIVGTNGAITNNYAIYSTGKIGYDATITTGGTTGNQTINKPSGTVNIAAAGTTVTVTNSMCTTSSIVSAWVRTNDTTAYIKNVVPGAGSFVITLGAAATAEVSIGFIVNN